MARKPKSNLARLGEANTTHQVAEFFHHVAAELICGEITTNGEQRYGDILNSDLGISVEVKSSDNDHSWRISLKQLNEHREILDGFPPVISDWFYILAGYKNSVRIKRDDPRPKRKYRAKLFSPLARLDTKPKRHRFLASAFHEAWLCDISVIEGLVKYRGITHGEFPNVPDHDFLRLRRRDVRKFSQEITGMLRSVNLDPRRYWFAEMPARISLRIDDHVYLTEFTLYVICRRRSRRNLIRLLEPLVLSTC